LKACKLIKHCKIARRRKKNALFYDIGLALGGLHHKIPQNDLLNMKFWKDRDGLSTAYSTLWNKQLDLMISKWVTRINPLSSDYQEFSSQLDELRQYDTASCEPAQLTLLHCDYIGRNILVGNDNRISGVIDFEAARIGDPIYDLAKIVWVNMDFSELDLRNAVLAGWESTYKQTVPKRKFLYYVGIQCLATIAWTDTHCSSDGTDPVFRASAIRTLKMVLNELHAL
jgi:aminoglycoside phosphotransferase (APT) family kinase protein